MRARGRARVVHACPFSSPFPYPCKRAMRARGSGGFHLFPQFLPSIRHFYVCLWLIFPHFRPCVHDPCKGGCTHHVRTFRSIRHFFVFRQKGGSHPVHALHVCTH